MTSTRKPNIPKKRENFGRRNRLLQLKISGSKGHKRHHYTRKLNEILPLKKSPQPTRKTKETVPRPRTQKL